MGILESIRSVFSGQGLPREPTELKTISFGLIGPVRVSWITRPIDSDQITQHDVMLYWEGDVLYQLEVRLPRPIMAAPLLLCRQPISVSGKSYQVKMIEGFTLPPCRIISPFEGEIGFSYTGWVGFRYGVETS